MTPEPHRIPERLLAELAAGGGGPEAVELFARITQSRNNLLLIALAELAHRAGKAEAYVVDQAMAAPADIADKDLDAVRDVLAYPVVSAWLATTVALLRGQGDGRPAPGHIAAVAAAAAIRARHEVRLTTVDSRRSVLVPSVGRAVFGRAGTDLRVAVADGVGTVHRAGTEGTWLRLPRIRATAGGLTLNAALDGTGWRPVRAEFGLTILEDAGDPDRWRGGIGSAWRLLARRHRASATEIAGATSVLIPLRSDGPGMVSGTLRQAFGAIALSAPHEARATAVTLAHEIQHGKLAVLMQALPLVPPDDGQRYRAAWRTDRRPLAALLQGAYAHLGVAAFWRAERTAGDRGARHTAQVEFARWRAAAYDATGDLLASRRLTAAGEFVVQGMRRVLHGFLQEPVPPAALARAAELTDEYRLRRA